MLVRRPSFQTPVALIAGSFLATQLGAAGETNKGGSESDRDRPVVVAADPRAYDDSDIEEDEDPESPRHLFIPNIGVTLVNYKETGVQDYAAALLTARLGYVRNFGARPWDLKLSVFMSGLPLSGGRPEVSARFAGGDARVGHRFLDSGAWALSLSGGFHYATMMVTAPTSKQLFGFKNMMGPLIIPMVGYRMPDGGSVGVYVRFAPISETPLSGLSFSRREIALGANWSPRLRRSRGMNVGLDYSMTDLEFPGGAVASEGIKINASMASLTLGFSL